MFEDGIKSSLRGKNVSRETFLGQSNMEGWCHYA